MTKRALVEHRPWLLASVAAALAYYFLQDSALGGLWVMIVKGAGVGALAIYAFLRGPGSSGRHIALVLGLGALADMAIENWFEAGGALFFLAHCFAMALFLKYPRHHTTGSQKALAVALLLVTPLVSYALSGNGQVALYALALGGMAATAWMSRFPRYRVGLGAVLFVLSDWLIFSQLGSFDLARLPQFAVWPLYYIGQFMIATGVVQTLRHELAEEDS